MLRTCACCASVGLMLGTAASAFAGGHGAATGWFNEDYSGYAAGAGGSWTTRAGSWTKSSADDRSTCSAAEGKVQLNTQEAELSFKPKAGDSSANSLVKVECQMAFTVCRDEEDWNAANDKTQQAAIGIRTREDGNGLTFFGWKSRWFHNNEGLDRSEISSGTWVDLSAPGLVPEADVLYTVTIENDQSCVPSRIRYSVNGQPLADSTGATWLTAKSPLKPWDASSKKTKKVCFRGRGQVGTIVATVAGGREERAKVEFAAVARPVVGTELTFTVTNKEGAVVGTDLSYRWYREDASGLRTEGSVAESATYAVTAADYGHWIAVDVSDENGYAGTGRFWCSNLPVALINVKANASGSVWPQKKGEEFNATMRLSGNDDYDQQYDGAVTIKVRGNSTSGQDKKPYKLKLDKKTDLFGLGGGTKNKHWVLLANAFDESLMRNKVAYDLSEKFGLVSMKSEWVDVVMNGQYVGNYLLCQHIRVGEDRVKVYDWSDASEKIAEKALEANPALTEDDQDALEGLLEEDCGWMSTGRFVYLGTNYVVKAKGTAGIGEDGSVTVVWKKFTNDISGGYIFELDPKKMPGAESPEASTFVQTNKNSIGTLYFHLAMNTPEFAFTNDDVRDYVWNRWWDVGQAWLSGTGLNAKGDHYRDLCDFDSMVGYWLSVYVPGNDDAGSYSRYAYQDQGGKLTFGPAWDFDCGMGSLSVRVRSKAETNEMGRVRYAAIQPEKWIPGNGSNNYMGHWTTDPYFSWKVREKYLEVRPYLEDLVKDGGILDGYIAKLTPSATANDIRWNNRIGFLGDEVEPGDAYVLKEFLTRRLAWLDVRFATAVDAVTNLTQTVNASALRYQRTAGLAVAFAGVQPMSDSVETDIADIASGQREVTATVTVPSGVSAAAVVLSVNGFSNSTWTVSAGTAQATVRRSDLERGQRNLLGFDAVDASGKVVARNLAILYRTPLGSVLLVR